MLKATPPPGYTEGPPRYYLSVHKHPRQFPHCPVVVGYDGVTRAEIARRRDAEEPMYFCVEGPIVVDLNERTKTMSTPDTFGDDEYDSDEDWDEEWDECDDWDDDDEDWDWDEDD